MHRAWQMVGVQQMVGPSPHWISENPGVKGNTTAHTSYPLTASHLNLQGCSVSSTLL